MNQKTKENLIRLAMKEADKAIKKGNSPFGAILTGNQGGIIAQAHNTVRSNHDPTAHAEINLLRQAGKKLGITYFDKFKVFGNGEPCPMCASACIKAGITYFYYGARREAAGIPNIGVKVIVSKSKRGVRIEKGILGDECAFQIKQGQNKNLK